MATSDSQPVTPLSDPAILGHLQNYHATRCCASPIYTLLLGTPTAPLFRFTSASKGIFTARLTLLPQHLNSGGGIHGSVSATLVDWAGGLAIAAWDLRAATGVSVDINVSYLSSAKLGEEIEIEGRVERVGANLAFTEVRIWKVLDGDGPGGGERGNMVISGRHTKFVRGGGGAK
jgi:acyl-coenzyme A thioesterase 13